MKATKIMLLSAATLLVTAPFAAAHVSVSADNATTGVHATLTLKVPHGCDGASTNKIEMQLPDGVTSFTPGRSTLWTPTMTEKKLDKPIKGGHGEEITTVPDVVTWTTKNPLPDHQLDVITSSIKLPDTEGPIYFPVVQTCEGGKTAEWTQTPSADGEEPESPAPMLTLSADQTKADDSSKTSDESATTKSTSDSSSAKIKELEEDIASARTLAFVGIGVGALGLLFGLIGMRRKR